MSSSPHGNRDVNGPDRPTYDADDDAALPYASLLRQASGPVPDDRVDWGAFHKRLTARAELSLARRRYPRVAITAMAPATARADGIRLLALPTHHPWWEPAARWARVIVAGSVAAGIALTVVVRTSPKEAVPDTVVASDVATTEQLDGRRAAFESLVTGHTTSSTVEAAILPSVTDLLIPLGKGAPVP